MTSTLRDREGRPGEYEVMDRDRAVGLLRVMSEDPPRYELVDLKTWKRVYLRNLDHGGDIKARTLGHFDGD